MSVILIFVQSRLALKPDGLFLAAILGGETLKLSIVTVLFLVFKFQSIMHKFAALFFSLVRIYE